MGKRIALRLIVASLAVFWCLQAGAREAPREEGAAEQDGKKHWAFGVEVAFDTKFVRRGMVVMDEYVLQPSLAFSYRGLTAAVWANADLTNENDAMYEITEIDYSLDYSGQWRKLKYSAGIIHYTRPDIGAHLDEPATTEAYAAIGYDVEFSPTLKCYQDIGQVHGTYLNLSIHHESKDFWRPAEWVSFSAGIGAAVGWGSHTHNDFYYGAGEMRGWGTPVHPNADRPHDSSAFTDLLLTLDIPIRLGRFWTVKPFVNWSTILDTRIRHAVKHDDNIFGGLAVSFGF